MKHTIDLNNRNELHLLRVAVLEKISSLNTEYWALQGPDATAVQLDQMSVRRAEYRVLSAQLEVGYSTASHKTWNGLSDGSALDKAKASVRRAQIAADKVAVDEELKSLQDWQSQLKESRAAERAAL
tara:strand:- start:2122 stop:2502 length:381 start_codon:yes stop_codon:yes gene_type:complete